MTYMYNMIKYNYTQGIFFVFVTAISLEFLFKYLFTTHRFSMKILLTRYIHLQSFLRTIKPISHVLTAVAIPRKTSGLAYTKTS